jgi:hypothetical protein
MVAAAKVAATLSRRGSQIRSPYRNTPFWRVYDRVAQAVDHAIGWDRLPTPLGLLVLTGIRNILRQSNLYDTTSEPGINRPPVAPRDAVNLTARTIDGTYNDLEAPAMGMAGSRFGRNVPVEHTYPDPEPALLTPNPRDVSLELLTRDEFLPATSVNVLAAAWLQFMIRDWFSHGRGSKERAWELPLREDDPWTEHPMKIPRTLPDPTRTSGAPSPPTYVNTETHWWDASQIYGSNQMFQTAVRSKKDGKLVIQDNGLMPRPTDPAMDPGQVPGWWLGMAMMQTLFTLEHNSICDRLRAEYPTWSDEDIFQRARLINAALLAKIHTVEWTPAVISHPTTEVALRANWWGIASERIKKVFGRLSDSEVVSGIAGSKTDHFGVPYSLTEEFVAVYRMHPLIPDDYSLRAAANDQLIGEYPFREIAGPHSQEVIEQVPMADLFYSFGTSYPGAITLHNYPRFLQDFERPDGKHTDLAATDILRARELGVPRYNQFRRLLHLKPADSFTDLTDNQEWAEEIRRVYQDDIERVDLMVGMFAERRPKGFAFSDTAFRIFVLMASRRLNSDRFFTNDFTPTVYTQPGLDWINDNDMMSVLLRHYPQLRPAMRGITNAFVPWTKTAS